MKYLYQLIYCLSASKSEELSVIDIGQKIHIGASLQNKHLQAQWCYETTQEVTLKFIFKKRKSAMLLPQNYNKTHAAGNSMEMM